MKSRDFMGYARAKMKLRLLVAIILFAASLAFASTNKRELYKKPQTQTFEKKL